MHRRLLPFTLALVLLAAALPARAAFQDYAYVNQIKVNRLSGGTLVITYADGHASLVHGIQATVIEVPTYEGCEFAGADYLAPADVASPIASHAAANGQKLMLNLQWVMFERVTFPCDPVGPNRLRADWEARLTTYAQHAAGFYNSGNVAYAIVHSEVNNSPQITQAQMVNAALRVKQLFPGIKTTAGYPTGTGTGGHPSVYPWPLDIVFTWNYSIQDPNTMAFIGGPYAAMVSRLRNAQTIGVLVEGFGGDAIGISGAGLDVLARRWCQFAKDQPKVSKVAGFYWGNGSDGGTDHIIHGGATAVEAAHRAVANAAANHGNGSCWAP